jgi:Collagen triple helix repeat (20 copies).
MSEYEIVLSGEGLQGIPGPKGDKGDKGDRGSQGPRGFLGLKGDQGDQGEQGDIGEQGEKGNTGSATNDWVALTPYIIGDRVTTPSGELAIAKTAHTSGATFTGNTDWFIGHQTGDPIPVAKSFGDDRPGVWEYTHNDDFGYLFHLLAGASFGTPASLIALGLDNGTGGGLLVANKASGVGVTIRQQATIANAAAYGLKVDGLSTVAPSVRIEQNVNGAADALQLLAFGAPTADQNLLLISAGGGNAGFIRAVDGRIDWRRDVTVRDNGATASGVRVGENSAYATWGDVAGYWSSHVKKGMDFYSPSGGGSLWRFAIETGGSYMNIRTGAAGAYGAAPTSDIIKIQHQKIAFHGATPVKKTGWTLPTGTKTRTGFSSDSVTLPVLAAHVAALLDDLHATAGYGLLNT